MPFPNPATQFKTGEQQVEIARKGGSKITPAKSLAAKLRKLKEKGLTDDTAQELYDILTSMDSADLRLQRQILTSYNEAKTGAEKNRAIALGIELRKIRHGTKITNEVSGTVAFDGKVQVVFEKPEVFSEVKVEEKVDSGKD
jgi:hypothetical protein